MFDRIPENPGRVKITPENGGVAYYATMERADNPVQVGTPLNKATLLTDETAALLGLNADAVPDDAFDALSHRAQFASGSYEGTGTYGVDNPCTLTFDFAPKMVFMLGYIDASGNYTAVFGAETAPSSQRHLHVMASNTPT